MFISFCKVFIDENTFRSRLQGLVESPVIRGTTQNDPWDNSK